MKRIKLEGTVLKSREEAVQAALELSMWQGVNGARQLELGAELALVKAKYQKDIDESEAKIEQALEHLQAWAAANPSEFGTAKSLDLVHAVIGWRTGTPALKPIGKRKWDAVLEKLKTVPGMKGFIRTIEEVDKAKILAAREELPAGDLKLIGVRVSQSEIFYAEMKTEKVENRVTVEKEAA